jgi:hypothetical protein
VVPIYWFNSELKLPIQEMIYVNFDKYISRICRHNDNIKKFILPILNKFEKDMRAIEPPIRKREIKFDIKEINTIISRLVGRDLYDLLMIHGIVISGSLIISMLIGREFEDSDIDIYCTITQFHELLVLHRYKLIPTPGIKSYGTYITDILEVKTYRYNERNLQFVILKDSCADIKKWICRTFDLSFCVASWEKGALYNVKTDELAEQRGSVNDEYISLFHPETDFSDYGIEIKGHKDVESLHRSYKYKRNRAAMGQLIKTLFRINKYIKRGFKIDNISAVLDMIMKYNCARH